MFPRFGTDSTTAETGHGDDPAGGRDDDRRAELDQVAGGGGHRHIFGIPGGAILPAYDPLMDSSIRHILVRHEQGAGHAAQGYAAATGGCRRVHGDLGARRHQPGDAARRRLHGLGADRGDHRPGRRRVDRHRRLPGGGHPRHHDADHQAQLPGHRPGRDPAHRWPRRSTSRRPGRPGPVLVDIAKSALQATTTYSWPSEIAPARLPAGHPARTPSRSRRPSG